MTFTGFRPELLQFLKGLRDNNSKEWFAAHRDEYDTYLLEPARAFVVAMGAKFAELGEHIHAEPKVHGSIFAITRDTRFSPDKTPYKSHLDLWFWQGSGPGLNRERPGYFFRLTPESLMLGAGMHGLSEPALDQYRNAVLDDQRGAALERIGQSISVGGRTYKRVPSGWPADHPRADWLRHSGLFAESELTPVPGQLFTHEAPGWVLDQFQRFKPLQEWLVELLAD